MSSLGDVLVVGLGASGMESARYVAGLVRSGEATSVTVVDSGASATLLGRAAELEGLGVRVELGVDSVTGTYQLAIVSPGISPSAPLFRSAQSVSARLISEIEFAFSRSDHAWVAVTGTNGKTTTTSLITHLLNEAGIPARSVGNIGAVAITAVSDADNTEVLVAEVSSFQLAHTDTFRPRVAVLLNITPDHLDWHGTFDEYAAAKIRVFDNLGAEDLAVIDVDDPGSAPYADRVAGRGVGVARVSLTARHAGGACLVGNMLVLETRGGEIRLVDADELLIRGAHNVSNALASAAAAHALGASAHDIQRGLVTFEPIEHRLEPVAEIDGVGWFNDSKATNPDAVLKALTAFGERPLILLLGGKNKDNDMHPLAEAVSARARAAVVFGQAADEIASAFAGLDVPLVRAGGLTEAVAAAGELAEPGDAVLLSPACASFDEFRSYGHRGDVFKSLVRARAREHAE